MAANETTNWKSSTYVHCHDCKDRDAIHKAIEEIGYNAVSDPGMGEAIFAVKGTIGYVVNARKKMRRLARGKPRFDVTIGVIS